MTDRIMCNLADEEPVVPSGRFACGDCGVELWVSDAMSPRVESGEILPVCEQCTLKLSPEYTFTIAPEQVPELERLGLREFAEDVAERWNTNMRRSVEKDGY